MSDGMSYGHWHDLSVIETVLIDLGGGARVAPDDAERLEHHLTHPPMCGRACHTCGTHPHCDVEYQVMEVGTDAYGELAPGRYRVRAWFERRPSGPWGGAEYDAGIEVEPATAGPEGQG